MKTYTLLAPAKINLFLEILGLRSDGFHELVMALHSIGLADRLTLRANGTENLRLFCSSAELAENEENLAYRAARLMREQFPQAFARYGGVDIELEKNIPIAAGLAGGSTDAAAVLVGLNLLWELGLTAPELQSLGAQLGSDIPFCVAGGAALATGRGEQIDPLPTLDNLWLVLAKYQSLTVSTPWAYQTYRQQFEENYLPSGAAQRGRTQEIHSGPLLQGLFQRSPVQVGQALYNDLEKAVLPAYPQVAQLREVMAATGGLGTMMSGSGPTVFTLCETESQVQEIKTLIRRQIPDPDLGLWTAPLISHGIRVLA
ncbi:MAG: 4-(cytidine 5'-diphospho)-2-C-methyl-D-erythritol kinase [Cyanobacteriota bacterium]|nr:4-(cytidine 5'-diphospho)-2-C-methyl-D-erythritol kinase [Cyanobacteriota bacterium]